MQTQATTTQPITRPQIAAALSTARAKVAADRRWLTALNKAALELEASRWAWFAGAAVLKVESRTTAGQWYTVTAQGCQCQAAARGAACWHIAARRLLVRAGEQPAPAVKPAPVAPRRSQIEVDELFA